MYKNIKIETSKTVWIIISISLWVLIETIDKAITHALWYQSEFLAWYIEISKMLCWMHIPKHEGQIQEKPKNKLLEVAG